MKILQRILLCLLTMTLCSNACEKEGVELPPTFTFHNDSDVDVCIAFVKVHECNNTHHQKFLGDIIASKVVKKGSHIQMGTFYENYEDGELHGTAYISVVEVEGFTFGELLWHRAFTEAELKAMNFTLHYPPADD